MNAGSEPVAGDVRAFTAEAVRPGGAWRRTLLLFVVVTAALCAGLWLARQKLRTIIAEKVQTHPADAETRPTNTGRVFEEAPLAKAPPVEAVPLSTPGGLNDPIPLARPAQHLLPDSVSPAPLSGTSPQSTVDAASPDVRPSFIVEPLGGPVATALEAASSSLASPNAGQNLEPGGLQLALSTTSPAAAEATKLIPRSLVLARGAYIPCVLESQLISNIAGFVSCIVTDNIYSDDGRTLLIERGAHVSGEYRSGMHQGDARLFVLWDRIKTPNGIVIDVASPGGDAVGGQGLPGEVDHHWWQRIGAAFLLSTFQDAVTIAIAKESASGSATTSVTTLPTNTTGTAQDMSKAVLDNTINIAPTLFKNRGELLTIYVARDLRFDHVYALQ